MSGPRIVSGEVRLLEALDAADGTLHVRVEDVSRVDAASRVVAETLIPIDHPIAAGEGIPFSVPIPQIDEGASYSIRAHLDLTGTAEVTVGDRVSTAAYPVLTHGHPDEVTVEAGTV